MPSLTKLTKSEIADFARTAVLANTPLSLFRGMVRCPGMDKLRNTPVHELTHYYDRVTARAERSEIGIGLAYAVLSAIILHTRDQGGIQVDPSRLYWGEQMWELATRGTIPTGLIVPPMTTQNPTATAMTSPPTETRFLYDPGGRVLPPWRNQ